MGSVQSKSEIIADSKTNQQNLTNAETEVECAVTKTFRGENSSAEELSSRC